MEAIRNALTEGLLVNIPLFIIRLSSFVIRPSSFLPFPVTTFLFLNESLQERSKCKGGCLYYTPPPYCLFLFLFPRNPFLTFLAFYLLSKSSLPFFSVSFRKTLTSPICPTSPTYQKTFFITTHLLISQSTNLLINGRCGSHL